VDNFAINVVAATRLGAACMGARSPWTNVVAAGADYALARNLDLVVGVSSDVRREAMVHRIAMSPQARSRRAEHAQLISVEQAPLPQSAAKRGAELLPTTVTVTRKPKNVHKTRINAGGYGAMGPHLERERLA